MQLPDQIRHAFRNSGFGSAWPRQVGAIFGEPMRQVQLASTKKSSLPKAWQNTDGAEAAGLRYISHLDAGIHRRRHGKGFVYVRGIRTVRDAATLIRIRNLVIPPAWEDVCICTDPRGHIQAIGRDQRGRRQYIYHPKWRQTRDQTKYEHLLDFARALPRIRRRVRRDLRLPGLPREKILAVVVQLLQSTHIRVGNAEYARENQSFGLTTLRDRHVRVHGNEIHFEFRGKSGVEHTIDLHNRRLAKIVRACQHLPGQELFQFVDDDGARHAIASDDVNEYLHALAGDGFTAKDFRTWSGTVLAAVALRECGACTSQSQAKKNTMIAITSVAKQLGNTKTICRKCYIHPAILSAYEDGTLLEPRDDDNARPHRDLRPEEAAVLAFLQNVARKSSLTKMAKG